MPRTYTTPQGTTLHFVRQIGSGQFGVANAVRNRQGDVYCMKEITIRNMDDTAKAQALTEVTLMRETCDHPNIVTFHDSWFERNRLCILMEYAEGGSLDKLIERYAKTKRSLPATRVTHFVEELAGALNYCHSVLGVIHRDIKPGNVLVDEIGSLKLADFGLSKTLGPSKLATTFCGSPMYMAPEQCTVGEYYSFPADMWAMGCVLFEVASLHSPWVNGAGVEPRSFPILVKRILDSTIDFSALTDRYPRRLVLTIQWMLQRSVTKRATAAGVVELLEMRAPPSFTDTLAETLIVPPTPNEDVRGQEDEGDAIRRRTALVRDAMLLANAVSSIQRSYRRSRCRRNAIPPLQDNDASETGRDATPALRPFDRPTAVASNQNNNKKEVPATRHSSRQARLKQQTYQSIITDHGSDRMDAPTDEAPITASPVTTMARPRRLGLAGGGVVARGGTNHGGGIPATPHDPTSAHRVLQKALRASLNRRRRDRVPRSAKPSSDPALVVDGDSMPPPPPQSRLQQLAMPRKAPLPAVIHVRQPRPPPPVGWNPPPPVRKAWM